MFASCVCVCVWLLLTGTALVLPPLCPRVSICPQRLCCPYCSSRLHPLKHRGLLHAEHWDGGGLSSPLESTRNTVLHIHHRERRTLTIVSRDFMFKLHTRPKFKWTSVIAVNVVLPGPRDLLKETF